MMNEMRRLMTLCEADRPVYHGTDQQFDTFSDDARASSTEHPTALLGHFVTPDAKHAATYPAYSQKKHVMALRLQHGRYYAMPIDHYYERFPRRTSPATVVAFRDQLRSEGYDGIEITPPEGDFPEALLGEVGTLIVFDPSHLRLHEAEDPYAIKLFHGTDKVFDRFAPYSHFGTEAQATMRHPKRILAVTVTARKFKRMRDTGDWNKAKLRAIERQGYDGVVYLNRYEGIPLEQFEAAYQTMPADKLDRLSDVQYQKLVPAAEDSYIVFDPYDVKIA
jgi:hypothetical protein